MEFQTNNFSNGFVSEFSADQPPATSYPDPHKPGQMGPMNPTPDIPGTDAPEVNTGTSIEPLTPDQQENSDSKEED
ncbi:hypothetical protein [Dyadobacter sp. NIV53]|uniref:hypothetical protein n=1 Tax=Dyadobacter sp. NIV53 TaxID=2861765 RepID=UPI001C878866|nr:hypothetical protein [Dyadobacter sp. NIV53]